MAAGSSRKDRSSPSDEAVYKVVLVGELGAGKSSIFMRFRDDIFHENYDGTRGMDHAVKPINTGNEKISVSKAFRPTCGCVGSRSMNLRVLSSVFYKTK